MQGPGTVDGGAAFSGDGRLAAFDDGPGRVVVLEVESGTQLAELRLGSEDDVTGYVRRLDDDGSHLVYGKTPIRLIEVATGDVVMEIDMLDSWIELTAATLFATSQRGTLHAFSLPDGDELFTVPGAGTGSIAAMTGGRILVSDGSNGAVVLETGPRGELGSLETCRGLASATLDTTGPVASFNHACADEQIAPGLIRTTAAVQTTYVVDLDGPSVAYTLPDAKGRSQPISPDGTRFVRQEGDGGLLNGPLIVRDLETGEPIVELQGLCWWDALEASRGESECMLNSEPPFAIGGATLRWSPDGTTIAAVNGSLRGAGAYLAVWDARTGELVFWEPSTTDLSHHVDAIFTPDSTAVVSSYWEPVLRRISTETWEIESEVPLPPVVAGSRGIRFAGYAGDGSALLAVEGLNVSQSFSGSFAALTWLDPSDLTVMFKRENIHDADLGAVALDSEGALLATGSADGVVRVWDVATGDLVGEIPLGDVRIRGVAFVDEQTLVVTPNEGDLLLLTIDTEQLLDIARESLTRGFTELECEKFNFGDACPTLEEMREGRRS